MNMIFDFKDWIESYGDIADEDSAWDLYHAVSGECQHGKFSCKRSGAMLVVQSDVTHVVLGIKGPEAKSTFLAIMDSYFTEYGGVDAAKYFADQMRKDD